MLEIPLDSWKSLITTKAIYFLILCFALKATGQTPAGFKQGSTALQRLPYMEVDTNSLPEVVYFIFQVKCKQPLLSSILIPEVPVSQPVASVGLSQKPLLKVTGSILYDLSYRSWLDTPVAAKDLFQHTFQTRLNFLYKDQYPFHISITTRFSNNNLFRKYFDVNYNYSATDFTRIAKTSLQQQLQHQLTKHMGKFDSVLTQILSLKSQLKQLNGELETTDIAMRLLSEREMSYWRQIALDRNERYNMDSVPNMLQDIDWKAIQSGPLKYVRSRIKSNDSLAPDNASPVLNYYSQLSIAKDSITRKLSELETQYNQFSAKELKYLDSGRSLLLQAKNMAELSGIAGSLGISDSCLPKGYRFLGALNNFAIGRASADYSELTVKNLSITGVQVEYNPRYYFAFAAGRVDFRFRDYLINRHQEPRQTVALVRFGKGFKTGNHIYFTYYTGRRQLFNNGNAFTSAPGAPVIVPGYLLAGISLAAQWQINRFTTLNTEWAKSTIPYFRLDSTLKSSWMQSLMKFRNAYNGAVSARLNGYLPKSATRFTAFLRYTGAGFQSFSLINNGSSALAWSARIEQNIKGNRFKLIAGVQQNDFQNPYIQQQFSSSALQANLQMTWRSKKGLVLMAGYYPSYQLVKLGQDDFGVTRYQTLIGTASHTYKLGNVQSSSMLVASRFYNESSDSGFIYFNSRNLILTQQFFIGQVTLGSSFQVSRNLDYSISSIEQTLSMDITKVLNVVSGAKIHWGSWDGGLRTGYSAGVQCRLGKWGDLQLQAEKGFLPGRNRTLINNNMGRLVYTQNF